jgi:hypothetical protein
MMLLKKVRSTNNWRGVAGDFLGVASNAPEFGDEPGFWSLEFGVWSSRVRADPVRLAFSSLIHSPDLLIPWTSSTPICLFKDRA